VALKEEIQSLNGGLNHFKKELKDRSLVIVGYEPSSAIHQTNQQRIDKLAEEQADLETKIKGLNSKIVDPSQIKVSKKEFLNTFKAAPNKIRAVQQ
jgi:cell division protein FtsB